MVVGAGGATLLAIMGGYALAKFRFPGRKAVSAVIIGSISVPGIVTTALFTIVATWNDCFLTLIMLKDSDWFPLTIGLNQWKDQASTAGGQAVQNLIITDWLITVIQLVIAFLCRQNFWQAGRAAGAVKEGARGRASVRLQHASRSSDGLDVRLAAGSPYGTCI